MKLNKDIQLLPFKDVFNWIKSQNPHENSPVYISKAKESSTKFRVWCFADVLLLASNENDRTIYQYVLTEEQWNVFVRFVEDNPDMSRDELGKHYLDFSFTHKTRFFWPSIIHICNEYIAAQNKK